MSVSSIDLEPRSRAHSFHELIADSCVHGLGLGAGIAGAIVLLIVAGHQGSSTKLVSVLIYSLALLAMLAASAAYNLGYATRFRALLRRFDHSAILLMIAGTYTPFTTYWHAGAVSVALTLGVWATTSAGIAVKFASPALFEKISVALFLGLGWASLAILGPIVTSIPMSSLVALVCGGLLYSFGVIFHLRQNMPFHNAIWHVFVLGAAACHYVAILTGVVLTSA